MRIKLLRRLVEKEIDEHPEREFDEYLDRDGVDLKEWGFMQGYYGEV